MCGRYIMWEVSSVRLMLFDLTFEGYVLDVEFWGYPSVATPAPVLWSVRPEDDDEHELELRGEPGASPDDAAAMLELALAMLY